MFLTSLWCPYRSCSTGSLLELWNPSGMKVRGLEADADAEILPWAGALGGPVVGPAGAAAAVTGSERGAVMAPATGAGTDAGVADFNGEFDTWTTVLGGPVMAGGRDAVDAAAGGAAAGEGTGSRAAAIVAEATSLLTSVDTGCVPPPVATLLTFTAGGCAFGEVVVAGTAAGGACTSDVALGRDG